MRLGRFGNVYPEHPAEGRNQDAMCVYVDLNNWTIETFVLGKTRGRDQTEKEETKEYREKPCSSIWHDELSFLREESEGHYRTRIKWKQTGNF